MVAGSRAEGRPEDDVGWSEESNMRRRLMVKGAVKSGTKPSALTDSRRDRLERKQSVHRMWWKREPGGHRD